MTVPKQKDAFWMWQAIDLAKHAAQAGEIPVGALVVYADKVIAEGWNQSISLCDPSAHAEIIALRKAAKHLGNYRLPNATVYVTLEPCAMCAGAMVHARIKNLVYASADPKAGAVDSIFTITRCKSLNHQINCRCGVLKNEASMLLKEFFQVRRSLRSQRKE